ncbi:MAG: hypothetical protein Q4G64_03685, partial [bacterium]|nr:hypothetical protein [bacterium]
MWSSLLTIALVVGGMFVPTAATAGEAAAADSVASAQARAALRTPVEGGVAPAQLSSQPAVTGIAPLGAWTPEGSRVTVDYVRKNDGTNHDNADRCWINSDNPAFAGTQAVDDDPLDGYVCKEDTVTYDLKYTVGPGTTPETYRLTVNSGSPDVLLDSRAWCSGGGLYAHTGTVVTSNPTSLTCEMTFTNATPSESRSITIPITFSSPLHRDNIPLAVAGETLPSVTIAPAGGGTAITTLDDGPVTWLATPTRDVLWTGDRLGSSDIYPLVHNGQSGYVLSFDTEIQTLTTPTAPAGVGPWSRTKGRTIQHLSGTLTVALPGNLPPETVLLDDPAYEGQWVMSADRTTATLTTTFGGERHIPRRGMTLKGDDLRIFIPIADAERYDLYSRDLTANFLPGAAGVNFDPIPNVPEPVSRNFGTGEQPGGDLEFDETTANWRGTNAVAGTFEGTPYRNNDWGAFRIPPPSGPGAFTKFPLWDKDGAPDWERGYTTAAVPTGGSDGLLDFWISFEAVPDLSSTEFLALCDTWNTKADQQASFAAGAQQAIYDPERPILAEIWVPEGTPGRNADGYVTIPADSYFIEWNFLTEAPNTPEALRCSASEGWERSATGTTWTGANGETSQFPNTFRLQLEYDVDLYPGGLPTGKEPIRLAVPFTSGPESVFPYYPESTHIYDMGRATFDENLLEWTGAVERYVTVRGSNVVPNVMGGQKIILGSNFDPDRYESGTTAPAAAEIAPGDVTHYYRPQVRYSTWTYVEGDPYMWPLELSLVTDTCVIPDLSGLVYETMPRGEDGAPVTWRLTGAVPADPGDDGVPCTADDVSGWTLTFATTGPVDIRTFNEVSAANTGSSLYPFALPFTVPVTAPDGESIDFTLTAFDPYPHMVGHSTGSTARPVAQPDIVQQDKRAITPRERVGEEIGWISQFQNFRDVDLGEARFIDVLPYNGDGTIRFADGQATETENDDALTNVRVSPGTGSAILLQWIWVTDAPSATIVNDAMNPANAWIGTGATPPADAPTWVPLAEADGLADEITAYYVVIPEFKRNTTYSMRVLADTDPNGAEDDLFINNNGVGQAIDTDGNPMVIPATGNVATVLWIPRPEITLEKTHTPEGLLTEGDEVTYTFTVTNSGNDDLSNIAVSDPMLVAAGVDLVAPTVKTTALGIQMPYEEPLLPGESAVFTAVYTITEADAAAGIVLNTATASGDPTSQEEPVTDTDDDEILTPGSPRLLLRKEISDALEPYRVMSLGEELTYTFTVENLGNIPMTNIWIDDATLLDENGDRISIAAASWTEGGVTTAFSDDAPFSADFRLEPGAVITFVSEPYTVTQADMDRGYKVNTAIAYGDGRGGDHDDPADDIASNEDDESIAGPNTGGIDIDKVARAVESSEYQDGRVEAGDRIAYTFDIRNTGSVTLSDVVFTDDKIAGLPLTCVSGAGEAWPVEPLEGDPGSWTIGTLPVGGAVTCTASYTVTAEDLEDAATGQKFATVDNEASVEGATPSGEQVTDRDDESVPTQCPSCGRLDITKASDLEDTVWDDGKASAGDQITYTLTVTNPGRVDVHNVLISDPLPGLSPLACVVTGSETVWLNDGTQSMAPGDSVTCTATYTVTTDDVAAGVVANTATAEGETVDGTPVIDDDSTVNPTASRTASIKVVKTAPEVRAGVGDTLVYTFDVTNTGTVPLSVLLEDPKVDVDAESCVVGGTPFDLASDLLAPGATVTCSSEEYTVTQADVAEGMVTNTVDVTGTSPDGTEVEDADTATVPTVFPNPGLSIDKIAVLDDTNTNGFADVDETITYTFTVTNTGNVDLVDVTVTDERLGLVGTDAIVIGDLAVGASVTVPEGGVGYTVTQDDVNAGNILNTATVTGDDGNDLTENPVAEDTEIVVVETLPRLEITKGSEVTDVNANGKNDAGDTITYTFTVFNAGNVTVTDVRVVDEMLAGLGIGIECDPTVLAPRESATCTAGAYTITEADVAEGAVRNVAHATGTDPEGDEVNSAPDTETVPTEPYLTGLALVKSSAITGDANGDGVAQVGDTVTYTFAVTNTGTVDVTGLQIADTFVTGGTGELSEIVCETRDLAAGSATTCEATYVVTQGDIDAR